MDNRFENLREKNYKLSKNIKSSLNKLEDMEKKAYRTADFAANVSIHLNDLEAQFKSVTKLSKQDYTFLFVAVALQCVRQYFLTDFKERLDDKTAAKNTKGHTEEHSHRSHRLYHPSIDEIRKNPVPFDSIYGSAKYGLGIGGGYNHRAKTLGHDPLLGWIFGTMNILTSTVTTNEFDSYHVRTGYVNGRARDEINKHANMSMILKYSYNRAINEGREGKTAVAAAIRREAVHLKSDIGTTAGIPLPVVSTVSIEASRKLASYGFDAINVLTVSKQAALSTFINFLIAMFHGLMYDESVEFSQKLYEVRTRKILMYSNTIASMSNVIAVALGSVIGNLTGQVEIAKKSLNYLDIGGFIVTIYRIATDKKFIGEIEREFLEHEWYNLVMEV